MYGIVNEDCGSTSPYHSSATCQACQKLKKEAFDDTAKELKTRAKELKTRAKELKTRLDPVNNPPHYKKHPSGIECIEVTRHMSFNLGNAVKYIWRADEKGNAIEDLEKAKWYIEDEIKKRKGEGK